jgi:lysophospholipase L1-like esterase
MCVGDSVTHGFVSDYPNVSRLGQTGYYVKKVSPPRFISLLSGIETINAGHGSYSAKDWWEKLCKTLDYSDSDIVTIELGYNGGLTDTLDVDVDPYSDYEDYANTNTGCYCKIIEYIQEQNENAYIVLVISSNFWDPLPKVVNEIAERYSLRIINLKDNSYIDLNDKKYHGYLNQQTQQAGTLDMTHFNALGYLFKAALMLHELERIVYSDYDTIHVKTEKRWCTSENYLYGYNTSGDVDTIILSDMTTESNRA